MAAATQRRPVRAIALTAGLSLLAGCGAVTRLAGMATGAGAGGGYHPAAATAPAKAAAPASDVSAPPPSAGSSGAPTLDAPRSRTLYLALIRNLRMTGKPYAALANLDEYERRYGRDDQAGVLRGDCLVDIKAYAQADAVYTRLLRGAAAAKAYRGLGRSAGAQGRWKDAATDFGEAVRREPAASDSLSDLGYALLKSGAAADAVFRLREAHELAPGDPTVLNNLILALSASGNTAEAQGLMDTLGPAEKARMTALLGAQGTGAVR
jgi:tetratricopeptide (TPR) repeat protein